MAQVLDKLDPADLQKIVTQFQQSHISEDTFKNCIQGLWDLSTDPVSKSCPKKSWKSKMSAVQSEELRGIKLSNDLGIVIETYEVIKSNPDFERAAFRICGAQYDKEFRYPSVNNPYGEEPDAKAIAHRVCKYMCKLISERTDNAKHNGTSDQQSECHDVRKWVRP